MGQLPAVQETSGRKEAPWRGRRLLASNMAWNWGYTLVEAVTAFLLAPVLVRYLGEHVYGLWILLGSVAVYMGLLDLGVRGSVGRYVAFHRAQGDRLAVAATFRSGLWVSTAAALMVVAVALGLEQALAAMINITPETATQLRPAFWLVVANLALSLPLSLFEAVLWGAQRFDRLSQIGIPLALLRLFVGYEVVVQGFGLVGLAAATLCLTLIAGAARALVAARIEPAAFSLRRTQVKGAFRDLVTYGLPTFVMTVSRMTRLQLVPGIVGWALGPTQVTHYSLSRRLVDYAEAFLVSATGVMTPTFASLEAEGDVGRQQQLFTLGGRLSAAVAFLFLGFVLLLGGPFLTLWLGAPWARHVPLLWVLALGEVLPLTQSVTGCMLLGLARHRRLAALLVAEVVAIALGTALVTRSYGLLGICAVLAIAGALFRGILVLTFGCRVLRLPLRTYLAETLAPAFLACGLAALGLQALVWLNPPTSWPRFVVSLAAYGFLSVPAVLVLGGPALVRVVRDMMPKAGPLVSEA
jgi:O-antigen/teichoic acid export membrane protein